MNLWPQIRPADAPIDSSSLIPGATGQPGGKWMDESMDTDQAGGYFQEDQEPAADAHMIRSHLFQGNRVTIR